MVLKVLWIVWAVGVGLGLVLSTIKFFVLGKKTKKAAELQTHMEEQERILRKKLEDLPHWWWSNNCSPDETPCPTCLATKRWAFNLRDVWTHFPDTFNFKGRYIPPPPNPGRNRAKKIGVILEISCNVCKSTWEMMPQFVYKAKIFETEETEKAKAEVKKLIDSIEKEDGDGRTNGRTI